MPLTRPFKKILSYADDFSSINSHPNSVLKWLIVLMITHVKGLFSSPLLKKTTMKMTQISKNFPHFSVWECYLLSILLACLTISFITQHVLKVSCQTWAAS